MKIEFSNSQIIAIALMICNVDNCSSDFKFSSSKHKTKRYIPLIFPPTAPTRIQWIVGIGIPLEDLLYEAMTTGYVFKAEYFLPDSIEKLKHHSTLNIKGRGSRSADSPTTLFERHLVNETALHSQRRRGIDKSILRSSRRTLSSYRWSIYKALEGLGDRVGLSGRSCILKSICEAAETPFHFKNGLLGELLHIVLTPSSSADELSEHSDNEYFHAEELGRSGATCSNVFTDCPRSLLEHITKVHLLSEDLSMIVG